MFLCPGLVIGIWLIRGKIGHTWPLKGARTKHCDQVDCWMWPLAELFSLHFYLWLFIPTALLNCCTPVWGNCTLSTPPRPFASFYLIHSFLLWSRKKKANKWHESRTKQAKTQTLKSKADKLPCVWLCKAYGIILIFFCVFVWVSVIGEKKKTGASECNIVFH